MAKVSYIAIPSGLDQTYKHNLNNGDRYYSPHVRAKRIPTGRPRKARIKNISPFISLAPVWQSFDSTIKDAWTAAALQSGMTGFKLFVQDTSARIKAGLPGYATPSELHQSKCGNISLVDSATHFKIAQLHPQNYYINKRIVGTRSQFQPVVLTEIFSLPLDIAISYKSNLISSGGSPSAKFFVIVYSNYQGRTIENRCEIIFDLSHDWQRLTASISSVIGVARGYTAFIELIDVQGGLYFDNVEINHSGFNWARDKNCNHVNVEFDRAYFQIPKNWAPEELVDGATYQSVYPV